MNQPTPYRWLLSRTTLAQAAEYLDQLGEGRARPGRRLANHLSKEGLPAMPEALIAALLQTKQPRIFAESEVAGDGSDWTMEEIALLGDISCLVPVTVFDDGTWSRPKVHEPPFPAHLVFVPGALLSPLGRAVSPDRREVVVGDHVDPDAYYRLYERRLCPVFDAIQRTAEVLGKGAVVSVPGLGCGQFSGGFPLHGPLGKTLHRLLEVHVERWPGLRLVHYDPYSGTGGGAWRIGRKLVYRIRPMAGGQGCPQLARVEDFDEGSDGLMDCHLFSLVAWDHVSWPGNDFYDGARGTDDGVKAAATDSMYRITGVAGRYDRTAFCYRPPADYGTWKEVVQGRGLRLTTEGTLWVVDP